jgi:hypothetical protein
MDAALVAAAGTVGHPMVRRRIPVFDSGAVDLAAAAAGAAECLARETFDW